MRSLEKRKSSWLKKILLLCLVCLLPVLLVSPRSMTAKMIKDSANGTKVIVLNYHKIDNMNISLSVLPKDFEAQMKYLKENNFHTITPDELYSALSGSTELPENPVLITFDDGYEDNYVYAYPILQKYGFKGTIFVITSFLDKNMKNYVTWEQAEEMEASGTISIQSHTVTHSSMTELSDEQLRHELADSKQAIESHLNKPIHFIAYPTGTYNLHIAQLVKEAGYDGAFTIKYGSVNKGSNIYALERVPIFHTENTNRSFLERIRYTPLFANFGWTKH